MVPYPSATDDHQTSNAQALVEAGGGWLMPQSNLDAANLSERLGSLLGNPAVLARAAGCAKAAAHLNAARDLADLVCGRANGNGQSANRRARDGDAQRGKEAAA
jgi:UDP-N-acetylglucosamine--N-acetylmuramyl-(pentapeptide) pyrophosphoryl-undecaprenol N-acetylglucosamine transferase